MANLITEISFVNTYLGGLGYWGGFHPRISFDGTFVSFDTVPGVASYVGYSGANLPPFIDVGGTLQSSGAEHVYLKNLATGALAVLDPVVLGAFGLDEAPGGDSASISADGRFVAYLVPGAYAFDLPYSGANVDQVNIRDSSTGTLILPNTTALGAAGNGDSGFGVLSTTGRYVAFRSSSSNLVANDTNGLSDVFLKDTLTGAVSLVSALGNGAQGNGSSYAQGVSTDGRYVLFETLATNLGGQQSARDVLLKDMSSGTLLDLGAVNLGAKHSSMTPDGRYVLFDISPFDGFRQVYRFDTITHATLLVSTGLNGAGNADSGATAIGDDIRAGSISADGRYVAFASSASNFVANDTNGSTFNPDIFVKDMSTGAIARVNVSANGAQANDNSLVPQISGDGHYVVFQSHASNLIAGDNNGNPDLFMAANPFWVPAPITGTDGPDNLAGSNGADTISGGAGNDTLAGGAGDDNLSGGSGDDQFSFSKSGNGVDTITDFADGDVIRVSGAGLVSPLANGDVATLALNHVNLSTSGNVTTLSIGTDGEPGADIAILLTGAFQAKQLYAFGSDIGFNHAPTGTVSISGTPTEGQSLSATNTLADLDGIPAAGAGSIGYQWRADGVPINGATGNSFVMTQAQLGKTMSVVASYTDGHGTLESVTGDIGKTVDLLAYSWKTHTLLEGVAVSATTHNGSTQNNGAASFPTVSETSLTISANRVIAAAEMDATASAVNLQDAIAILKMIVGLEVNGAGRELSPYQALAADFDGNGLVGLSDAIGVLRHVVGLSAPQPTWHFANEADTAVPHLANLSPGSAPTIHASLGGVSPVHIGLVGYLSGDVDGSYGGGGTQDLDVSQSDYFTALVTAHPGLSLAQFGVYGG